MSEKDSLLTVRGISDHKNDATSGSRGHCIVPEMRNEE
jgi:hypothetical protein